MGVVDKLNALDERAGAGKPVSRRWWAWSVRLWWVFLVVPFVFEAATYFLGGELSLWLVPAVFASGFLYNERLRELRKQPLLMRVPPGWPNETP